MEASEGWERTRVDIDLMDVGFGRNDDDDNGGGDGDNGGAEGKVEADEGWERIRVDNVVMLLQ